MPDRADERIRRVFHIFIIFDLKSQHYNYSCYLALRILHVTSQASDQGLSLGNVEWDAFVLSVYAYSEG